MSSLVKQVELLNRLRDAVEPSLSRHGVQFVEIVSNALLEQVLAFNLAATWFDSLTEPPAIDLDGQPLDPGPIGDPQPTKYDDDVHTD